MIVDALFSWASSIPPWFATIVLSALPITECRLTIPVAILSWHLSPLAAYALAMIGNAIPIAPIFFGFQWFRSWAAKTAPWMTTWLDRAIDHAHQKLGRHYEQYGIVALVVLSAIPIPGGGIWTGALAAVALKISWKRSWPALVAGMLIMGAIVLAATVAGSVVV